MRAGAHAKIVSRVAVLADGPHIVGFSPLQQRGCFLLEISPRCGVLPPRFQGNPVAI
jgi:hypothetical protein